MDHLRPYHDACAGLRIPLECPRTQQSLAALRVPATSHGRDRPERETAELLRRD